MGWRYDQLGGSGLCRQQSYVNQPLYPTSLADSHGSIADQFMATVSKVTIQCEDSLQIGPKTISYVWGANDTTGVPNVLASNETTLLNGAQGRFSGVQPWTVMAVGAALGYFAL